MSKKLNQMIGEELTKLLGERAPDELGGPQAAPSAAKAGPNLSPLSPSHASPKMMAAFTGPVGSEVPTHGAMSAPRGFRQSGDQYKRGVRQDILSYTPENMPDAPMVDRNLEEMIKEEFASVLGEMEKNKIPGMEEIGGYDDHGVYMPSRPASQKIGPSMGAAPARGVHQAYRPRTWKDSLSDAIHALPEPTITTMEQMIREEFESLLNEMQKSQIPGASELGHDEYGVPSGLKVKVPSSSKVPEEPGIRDAIKYIMQKQGHLKPLVPGPPGVVENITWTDVQNALRTGADNPTRSPQPVGEQPDPAGADMANKEVAPAVGKLNESQDPFKRISELALKSYGTCRYED
ncbi:hypothetical protein [uncultured Mediterranean phage]|nr:hypothetical protein [uncultured Mediterranean phage]